MPSPVAIEPIRRLKTDILLIDVVDFSLLSDEDQYITVLIINTGLAEAMNYIGLPVVMDEPDVVQGVVPTGDGCYVILNPKLAGFSPILALGLRNILLFRSKQARRVFSGVRVSVHFGDVIPFKDATGKVNFIGSGMNDCARLQSIPDHLKKVAEHFSNDKNWVNVSRECWDHSTSRFDYLRISNMEFKCSDEYSFKDKHDRTHVCRFLEMSRVWVSGL
ncbi:MAG: hypothetical protein HQL82_15020 [Magnetococcales bacterium]|nr:hypothetical protein [Magnetococcales bacterium]